MLAIEANVSVSMKALAPLEAISLVTAVFMPAEVSLSLAPSLRLQKHYQRF